MTTIRFRRSAVAALALAALACGREAARSVRVEIAEPAEGAVVPGPDVRVLLTASGIEIAPAADERPGTGHHHLFIDGDVTPLADTIPQGVTGIIHLGRGQTEFTITGLSPGDHRVIAVLADWGHVPLSPPAMDTVRFTVRQP